MVDSCFRDATLRIKQHLVPQGVTYPLALPSNALRHPNNPGVFVLGVPPPFRVTTSPIPTTSHPSGTGPISESTKRVGRESKTCWGMEGNESAPAALAFTGSKSTNHARKVARVSRSSALRRLLVLLNLVVESAKDVRRLRVARRGRKMGSRLE